MGEEVGSSEGTGVGDMLLDDEVVLSRNKWSAVRSSIELARDGYCTPTDT